MADNETNILASVVNDLGDYTPYGASMKEAHPELSDKAIAHLHYFGGLNDTDVEYEAHRLALRDKHGAAGLHLLYESSTRLSANSRKLKELPAEIQDIPEADDADTDAEEYQGAFKAIGDVAGAVANDVRKLAPTQGNDLIEGVGLGVQQADMSLDKLGEKLVTALPEPLKDDRSEGFFKLTPQSPEELAWLNANAQPDPGEPRKFFFGLITKDAPEVPQNAFEQGVQGEYQLTHGTVRAYREAFPASSSEYTGKQNAEEHDALLAKMDNLDSISGGFVKEISEFAALSAFTGGGLGATGVLTKAGIAIAKPAAIDQIIFEENDGLAIQNAVTALGTSAPLWMSEVEDEPLLNRTKLLVESGLFGTVGEIAGAGVMALAKGDLKGATKAADAARGVAIEAQAELALEQSEALNRSFLDNVEAPANNKIEDPAERLLQGSSDDQAALLANAGEGVNNKIGDPAERMLDNAAQQQNDLLNSAQTPANSKSGVVETPASEATPKATTSKDTTTKSPYNNVVAQRVSQAMRDTDTAARTAENKLAAGAALKDDVDPEVLNNMTGMKDFVSTIGHDDIADGLDAVKGSMKARYDRTRTTFAAAKSSAKKTLKMLRKEYGDNIPASMLIELDTPDAIADFNTRLVYLKGIERKIDVLGKVLRGEQSMEELTPLLKEAGEEWILELNTSPKQFPMIAAAVRELQADAAAIGSKQKAEVRKGAQLLRAAREVRTPKGQKAMEDILNAQAARGEISAQALGQKLQALEAGTAKGKQKFAALKYDETNTLFDDTLLFGQGNMLLSANVWSLNMVVEPLRMAYLGTIGGLTRALSEAFKGNLGEAARITKKGALFFEGRKQFRRGLKGFATVWRTSNADLSNSADSLGMATAEMNRAKSIKDIWNDTAKINGVIPTLGLRAGLRVLGSASYRVIAGISEFSTQVFYHHNVELDALTGVYGKKWQDLRKKNGYLTDDEMSAMLMSFRDKSELTETGGRFYDTAYVKLAAESGFRNKEQNTIKGAEQLVGKNNAVAKTVKLLFPFFGMGLRTGREGVFMAIPGFSLLSKTTRAKMGFGMGETVKDQFGNLRPLEVETDQRVIDSMRAHYLAGPAAAMGAAVAAWMYNNTADDDEELLYLPDPGEFRIKGVSSKFGETDQGIIVEVDGKELTFNFSEMLTPFAAFALTTSLLDYTFSPSRTTDELNMAQDVGNVLAIATNATFGQQSVVRGLQSQLKLFDAKRPEDALAKWALAKGSAYSPFNPLQKSIKTVVDEELMRGSARLDIMRNPGEAFKENFYNLTAIGEWNVGNKRRSVTGHLTPGFGRGISPMSNQAEAYKSKAYLEEMKLQYGVDLSRDKIMVPGTEIDLSLVYLDSGQSIADAMAASLMTATFPVRANEAPVTLDDALYEQFTEDKSELNVAFRTLKAAANAGEDPATQDNTGGDALQRPEKVLQDIVRGYRDAAYNKFMADLKASAPAEFKRVEELVESRRGGAIFDTMTNFERKEVDLFVTDGEQL